MLFVKGKHQFLAVFVVLCMLVVMVIGLLPGSAINAYAATNYYVDGKAGNDHNKGTDKGAPFKTIQKASTIATGGSIVNIRAGTYRETVTPTNNGTSGNPITYQNYNGEAVTVSGCDLVTGWTQYSGSIYRATMNWNFDSGYGNMVYADGNMMVEARWPNITAITDYLDPTKYASVDSATTGTRGTSDSTIVDSDLTSFANNYWSGALVWCGNGVDYVSSVANIDSSTQSTGTISHYPWSDAASWYNTNCWGYINKYMIFRSLKALDTQKEWYYDGTNNYLYFMAPGGDSPAKHIVEAKKRAYAFDLGGKSYITLKNIGLRGTSINFTSTTNNCTIDGSNVNGVDTYLRADMRAGTYTTGIKMDGTYNIIKNSEIYNTAAMAITMKGSYNSVVNNYIHDTNMFMYNGGGVEVNGHDQLISNNTICNTGYIGIYLIRCGHSVVQYNDVYNTCMIGNDGGAIYAVMCDLDGTEFHHNKVHDNKALYTWGAGIYLDCDTFNGLVYDNVIWNSNTGMDDVLFGAGDDYIDFINNTVYRGNNGYILPARANAASSSQNNHYYNNIACYWSGATPQTSSNNIIQTADPGFVNKGSNDVHLTSSSVAKDAGLVVPDITDGYVGSAPDCGAYEYGGTDWTAGHNFSSPPSPTLTFKNLASRSKITNGGFEYGDLTNWTKTGSQVVNVVDGDSWDYQNANTIPNGIVQHGYWAAQIKTGSGIQQTITGLEPSTTYKLNASVLINGYYSKATAYSSGSGSAHWNFDKDGTTPATYRFMKYVGPMRDGDYLKFSSIDFGSSALYNSFAAGLVNSVAGKTIEVRIDSTTGTLLGTLTLAGNLNQWLFQSCSISSTTGTHDLYLVFHGTGDISFIESFKLYNSTMSDTVTAGVNSYGGSDTSVSTITGATIWSNNLSVEFTTGETNTSATVYFTKSSGSYYGYVDHVFVTKADLTPTMLFSDNFENGMSNWSVFTGSPVTSTSQKHGGIASFAALGYDSIVKTLGTSWYNTAKVWFYDDASDTTLQNVAIVGDSTNDRGLGVNTPTSTGYYCYRVGSTYTATGVARSTGWHEFKFDYTSGTSVDMYIDGIPVATGITGVTSFNRIVLGNTTGSNSGNVYWDDFITVPIIYQYIDDDSPLVTYSGTWTDDNNDPGYYNYNRHYTVTTNAYCQTSFTGTSIQVITEKYSNRGLADIYIDNVFDSTVDGYAATAQAQAVLYNKTGLSNGSHTIKVVCKGQHSASSTGNYVIIDAFRYR